MVEPEEREDKKKFSRDRHRLPTAGWFGYLKGRWSTVFVAACVGAVAVLTAFFSYFHGLGPLLVMLSLFPGLLLGMALLGVERLLVLVKGMLFVRLERLLTCFLLFFIHLLGYMLLSSLLVSYPLGWLLGRIWGQETTSLAVEYGLFSANVFMLAAIASWLHNVRSLFYRSQ